VHKVEGVHKNFASKNKKSFFLGVKKAKEVKKALRSYLD
jgi:hypothetical protein